MNVKNFNLDYRVRDEYLMPKAYGWSCHVVIYHDEEQIYIPLIPPID